MSTLHIPDGLFKQAGITEQDAVIELACRLFDTGRLSLFFAAKLAGMRRSQFEDVLLDRKIPVYRYSQEQFDEDVRNGSDLEE